MTMDARFALLFGLALAMPGCGSNDDGKVTGTTTQRPFAQRLPDVAGLDNFARVNPTLYRGAQPTEEGFRQLKAMGVKTVIDFRSYHSTKKQVEAAGLTAVEIPLKADLGSTPPDDEALKKFFEVVLDPAKQPVYIHCAFGKDRTGTMAAVYRLEVDHWTAEEALQEMEAFGYHNIYRDLINFVKSYKCRGFVQGPAPR
jgi:tyrosine-protein phosphatase SIW14